MQLETINHPILIIGLGGTGTDALLRVKAQARRRFAINGQLPENIAFLAIESNKHDKKNYQGTTLDANELVLLANASIGSILNNRSTLPSYISEWLSPELTISDGMKGASGNRQAGRLLLFEKINTVIDAVDAKIRKLRIQQENKLLVFILTGVSGGTGGGIFLDIPYIVRGLMERDYGKKGIDRVEINGYFFTPDVHIAGNALNIHSEEYIQRNGYAALKELDYWMNIEERAGEFFTQQYGTRLQVRSALPPYNLCHLVCATNIDGVYLRDAYPHCLEITSENIIDFLAREEKTDEREFAIHDYQSNLLANIATMKSNLPAEAHHSANYIYNIMGAAAVSLPITDAEEELLHRLLDELDPIFDAMPDAQDLKDLTQATGLAQEFFAVEMKSKLPLMQLGAAQTDYFNFANVVKTQRISADAKLNDLLMQTKYVLGNSKQAAAALFEKVKTALTQAVASTQQGPIFAARLLESTTNPCLLAWLENTTQQLQEKQQRANEEIEMLMITAATRFEEAQNAGIFSRERKKNAYLQAKVDEYQARSQSVCDAWRIDVYKAVHPALEQLHRSFYAPRAAALHDMKQTTDATRHDRSPSHPPSTSFISIHEILAEASKFDEEQNKNARIRAFLQHIADCDAAHIKAHCASFIRAYYNTVLTRPMDDYIADEAHVIQLVTRLNREALPVFHLDNAANMYVFPGYSVVSVPHNAPRVQRAVEKFRENFTSGQRFNLRHSSITDRIFWLNTQNGLPLFAYTPLRVYEALYEQTLGTKESVGRHFWPNLPSPLPETVWGDTYTNTRQKAENDRIRAVFNEAMALGVIELVGNRYVVKVHRESVGGNLPPTGFGASQLYVGNDRAQAMAFFARYPRLVALVSAENDKRNAIQNARVALEKHQQSQTDEKILIDELVTALSGEAIIRQNEQFIYNQPPGETRRPPLTRILDHPDHPEYALFRAYQSLSESNKQSIRDRAVKLRSNFPDGRLLENLKSWKSAFLSRKSALEADADAADANITDANATDTHAAARNFYHAAIKRFDAYIAALK
ncbi:MAG: tubulin-like doman-containing protein [Defluviitaleaceae bacterium]|nr:tubulin-like doman-containing protein [Defluviitaleaceae bacterium]